MNNLEGVLKALGFSDEMIREAISYESNKAFDNDLPIIECEIEDEGSYSSNNAIVETYSD